jgi:LCP family protein required for cell wall assembly
MPSLPPPEPDRYGRGDNLRPVYTPLDKKKRSRLTEWILFGVLAVIAIIGAIALYTQYAPSFKTVPNRVAEGFKNDRINIVLIGVGGPTHPGEGKNLADAIMVLSLKPSKRQAALISLPRDFYLKIGRFGMHRLNAAHGLGEDNGYPGGGPALLMDTAEQIVGEPMHAYIRIDFAAFEKIIDELGGVDIYVYRPFYDYLFKDQFNAGWQHMKGKRALRYARLRYIKASAEGNNFARELRQQQVISALRDKMSHLTPQQALRLVQVARTVSKYTDTNLTTGQMIDLYSMFHDMDRNNIRHVSMAPFTTIIMVTDPADAGEAVQPRTGDYNEIHVVARSIFTSTKPVVTRDEIQLSPPPPKPAVIPESESLASATPSRY